MFFFLEKDKNETRNQEIDESFDSLDKIWI